MNVCRAEQDESFAPISGAVGALVSRSSPQTTPSRVFRVPLDNAKIGRAMRCHNLIAIGSTFDLVMRTQGSATPPKLSIEVLRSQQIRHSLVGGIRPSPAAAPPHMRQGTHDGVTAQSATLNRLRPVAVVAPKDGQVDQPDQPESEILPNRSQACHGFRGERVTCRPAMRFDPA